MLTVERLRELLNYSPETGVFIWKVDRRGAALAGSVAGTVSRRDGYRRVLVDNTSYLAHRLVWFYVHGRWPAQYIDHINLDRLDNRLANLREANQSQSAANRRQFNKYGLKGIRLARGKWYFQIQRGPFATPLEAHEAYMQLTRQIYGEFARA